MLVILCALHAQLAWGAEAQDENSDLELIPKSLPTAEGKNGAGAERPAPTGRGYLEDALTGWWNRDLLVPVPSPVPSWQNRASLDLDYSWQLAPTARFGISNRLSLFAANTIDFPSAGTVRNDLREAVVSWEPFPRTYLEAGRINLKNGTALGYNPTDYFKARSTVDLASIDPSALRENRLGTVMVEGQKIWDQGTVTLVFAPKLQGATALGTTPASLDPLFGRTNSENRFLASVSCNIADLSPQLLLFHDRIGTHVGANVSRVIGSSVVTYLEWSGVRESDLTARAVGFGRETGTLPAGAPLVPQGDPGKRFQSDAAVGASWTSSTKLTINLEYHYHQAGLNGAAFDRWIALGDNNGTLAPELWYIREYAGDRQEPVMQHQFFLRFDYPDALPSRLNLSGVFFISPYDGSFISQASAQYFISREWTVGAYVGGIAGSRRSVEGSLPWAASGVLQIVRYL